MINEPERFYMLKGRVFKTEIEKKLRVSGLGVKTVDCGIAELHWNIWYLKEYVSVSFYGGWYEDNKSAIIKTLHSMSLKRMKELVGNSMRCISSDKFFNS